MKSPKDILLEQHADTTPALNRIRAQVVAELREPEQRNTTKFSFFHDAWRELFWRPRRVWASLATVWAALLMISVADIRPEFPAPRAAQKPAPRLPIWEQHHNVLRAELGLPIEQRAQKTDKEKPAAIHQSRHRSRFELA